MKGGILCRYQPATARLFCVVVFLGTVASCPPFSNAENVLKHASAAFTPEKLIPNSGVTIQTSKPFQEYGHPLPRHTQFSRKVLEDTALSKESEGLKNSLSVKNPVREASDHPEPKRWPDQFHAQIFQNRSDNLALVDLWYDWPGGRNLNLIHSQLGSSLWDVEWTNGTR